MDNYVSVLENRGYLVEALLKTNTDEVFWNVGY